MDPSASNPGVMARVEGAIASSRRCLACGYDLQGLGEEPRCPECGLLNIPEGFRRQVQQLVDSGRRFFSAPFQFFRKRPAGWYWALDRPGDVRRSLVSAMRHVVLSAILLGAALGVLDSIGVQLSAEYLYVRRGDPGGVERSAGTDVVFAGLGGFGRVGEGSVDHDTWLAAASKSRRTVFSRQVVWRPSLVGVSVAGAILVYLIINWLTPAGVGIWTQIRSGLPPFARARRSILAATLHEAHRMPYNALWFIVAFGLETAVRVATLSWAGLSSQRHETITLAVIGAAALLTMLGWIGPLRSDYTRQLVRSRVHAVRIFLMYVVLPPFLPFLGAFLARFGV